MCTLNENGEPELSACTSAGVGGEEVHLDDLSHISEGKTGWLPVARNGKCCRKGRSHLLILEVSFHYSQPAVPG